MDEKDTLWLNIRNFLFRQAPQNTLIVFRSEKERDEHCQRILQRLDVAVQDYSVLNIHKIGLNVPGRYVFEELLKWNGSSPYWPNRIARVERVEDQIEHIQIYLFGLKIVVERLGQNWPLVKYIRLFNLDVIQICSLPDRSDRDNARFLLYKCSGGYPIGIFSLYIRSSINSLNEMEQTQLFLLVAFNFYGKKQWFFTKIVNRFWQMVHNRVTENILSMIKQSFESQFRTAIENMARPDPPGQESAVN